ncbi:MFS transporter [Sphingobacterium sp. SGG-5]|nr:MFS transporter [Sphingobacterium sp. SGG-5]
MAPETHLHKEQVDKGLKMVIIDGLASEVVVCLTSGVFLVAVALLLGASNFQIGLLAAFPTLTNLAQLLSIIWMRYYPNRRLITVSSVFLARLPLIIVAIMLYLPDKSSIYLLMLCMFVHYFFSSVGGAGWNSWIKDLVPEDQLGSYFSKRSRYMQIVNIILSLFVAVLADYVQANMPDNMFALYAFYFATAGLIGLIGTFFLSRAPEPYSSMSEGNLLQLLVLPLKNVNFRRLLIFNAAWTFSINLAIPFFIVFMLKSLGLSMTVVIFLTVVSQLFSVLTLYQWGRLSDRYSNKSIIMLSAPIYIVCILLWIFVGIYSRNILNLGLLFIIHVFTGISTAGINLALTNIGLKLAPKQDAVVFISMKNIVSSLFAALGPIIGGILVDIFDERELRITIEWISPELQSAGKLLYLHEWNFLFLFASLMAFISMRLLGRVKENGEVGHMLVKRIMKTRFKSGMKEALIIGNIITWHNQIKAIIQRRYKTATPEESS